MKNVLFATTALVGVAGVAFAGSDGPVALSGSAEMGITYVDDGTDENVEFHNDIDVTFTLSGSTSGLTFGASIDLDEADGGDVIESSNSVFIEGAFGTLTMGDTDGAYDQALDGIAAAGLNDEADIASGTSGLDGVADGEILRYDYSISAFTFSASLELEEDGVVFVDATGDAADIDNIYGLGAQYTGSFGGIDVDLGAGVQFTSTDTSAGSAVTVGDGDHTVFGGSAGIGFGGFELVGVIEIFDRPSNATLFEDGEIYGISGQYTTGPVSVALGYELDTTAIGDDVNRIQGFATYDLGGGAELIGAASYEDDGTTETILAGFGIGLSF